MSKTFKSAVTPETHRLIIGTINDNQVLLETDTPHVAQAVRVAIATAEAPAVALAILEAAYPPADYVLDGSPESFLAVAASYLRKASRAIESKAKEAADREARELLGRKLYNSDRSACDLIWEDLSPGSKNRWVDRMTKAREIIEATK